MKTRFAFYILGATVLGAAFGHFFPEIGKDIKILGDAFIRLLKMIVIPVIVTTLLVGIAGIGDIKRMGRIGVKTVIWFEVITTAILFIGLAIANIVKPGKGLDLANLPQADLTTIASNTSKVLDGKTLLLNIIPTNIIDVMAKNDLLAVIFFCILFGVALVKLGNESKPFVSMIEIASKASFKLVNMVMMFAPIGVFALMAATIGTYGITLIIPLLKLIGTAYLGLAVVVFGLFSLIALMLRVPIKEIYRMVWDLMIVGASTGSTETVVPQLMQRLEKYGVPKYITSFVIPAGMPLNSDGTTLYLTIAGPFIAQAFGIDMSWQQQLMMVLFFIVTSKGVAAVPSSSMVILLATVTAVGLPPEGVALIIGIDRIIDMARTAVNVFGHVFSCIAVAKWEGVFRKETETVEPSSASA
ncbi:dicarboxylate/amino acid:cation symporter [Brevibacillus reuszeri]|uniref:dicarboxylate/amino acid:cation symporter n=1 Tax=Brevibacillus reuszeri TaxID=54915 RepID=UPI00289972C3|nr:cation:dicarboxylase symporter family transporter [Brevibacillus reuszeri]